MAHDEAIREQAAAWAVRTGEPGFDDWDAFMAWLEESRAHALAYERMTAAVADAAEALEAAPPVPAPSNDDERGLWTRRRWFGGALAAVCAGVLALGAWQLRGDTYVIETGPGETRVIELDGGGQIAVAGDSRLVIDRDNDRLASLERGRALFTVEHHEAAPFKLTVGKHTLVDIGTVFDVTHTPERMSVAVSEGAVMVNPGRQNIRVDPGQMLTSMTGSDLFEVTPIPLAEVGEWQAGRLTFRNAPLAQVAADLSRATGVHFLVAARAADRSVSGSLTLDGVKADPRTVGSLLGVAIRHTGDAWEIGAQ